MTQMHQSVRPWSGETARIDAGLLRKAADELQAPMYYLAGPPAMAAAARQALTLAGVGAERIRSEEFFGY